MRSIPVQLLVALSFLSFQTLAQVNPIDWYQKNKLFKVEQKNLKSSQFFEAYSNSLGLTPKDEMIPLKSFTDKYHFTRRKYKQHHNGIPVIGATYTLHEKDGRVVKATGNLFPQLDIRDNAKINSHKATELATSALEKALIKADEIVSAKDVLWQADYLQKCIIDQDYPSVSGKFLLAHEVIISCDDYELPIKEKVYINAINGELINHFSIIKHGAVIGKAMTRYYGEVEFTTDSIAPDLYLLRDFTRGDGVITLDYNLERDTVSDSDNIWDNFNEDLDEVAGDAHYCTTKYYDMMLEYFDWDGLDNEGGKLVSVVHTRGKYYVNAYWNGEETNYGNGDCHRYGPLTTLTVVGHEFAHGWTDYTSDLVYRYESGALNESISDIIGKALEDYADPENFTWNIGDHVRLNDDVNVFRSMSNPADRNDPKFYNGAHWFPGNGDNGGVHTNSGVFNYWFYLLVEGGADFNEDSIAYDVKSIGMRDALDIVFGVQTGYLTEYSNYFDCLYYSIEAVIDLFGENSDQHIAVLEAWKAVGLYPGYNDLDLRLELVENAIPICPGDEKAVAIKIRNVGRLTYPANQWISLTFNDRIDTVISEQFKLEEELLVGETLVYILKNAKITDQTTKDIRINMIDVDVNTLNNSVTGDVNVSEIDGLDLQLLRFEFTPTDNCAEKKLDLFKFSIKNLGCKVILEEEEYFLDIESDVGDFTISRSVISDFLPGNIQGSSVSVDSIDVPEGISDYQATLRIENDIIPDNNIFESKVTYMESIEDGYREQFSLDVLENKYSIDTNSDRIKDSIITYNGNEMLSFSRISDASNYVDCEDPLGFFWVIAVNQN